MKSKIVWLTAISIVFMGFGLSRGQEAENLLENGGFENGDMTGWNIYGGHEAEVVTELTGAAVPEDPIEGMHALHITVPSAGTNFWDVGLQHQGHVFESGKKYTLSAFLKSKSGELNINFKPELGQDPWTGYGSQAFTMTEEWTEFSVTTPVFTEDVSPGTITFHIAYDEGDFWIDGVRWYEGDYVPAAFKPVVEATEPNPEDGATDVPQDVILSWTPSSQAAAHDVYFGESFDDVNNAPTMNTLDMLRSDDQQETFYDPEGLLDFGKKYFWRIDEVNAPPDSTAFKGPVWSFTVENFAYPITNISATASSENKPEMAADNTVNGSGLDGDLHSTDAEEMWLSHRDGEQPTWIEFEFDQPYELYELWVWNQNQVIEENIGFGVKDVTIEHSLDGVTWTTLGDFEIAQAPGEPDNPHDDTIDLSGVYAQYVRMTIHSNWVGLLQQYGLSEVRFYYVPVEANDPTPAAGDSDVPLDVTLDWRAGREAVTHEVYFSKDEAEVVDGTALAGTVSESRFQPGTLEYGQVYYWKVNEVNEDAPVPVREGEVWQFSTVENLIVEDFESYTDDDANGEAIWQTWIDGFDNPQNGSQVGYLVPPYAEQSIVFSGRQSMPFFYDNSPGGANFSEATRTFDQARDWTTGGVSQLSLWYQGFPASLGSFVQAGGTITMTGSGSDIWGNSDEFHFAYKTLTGPGTIVARVQSVDNTDPWAKAGVMIRETLDPDSKHAFGCVTPENGVASQGRIDTGSSSFNTAEGGITAPHWVKLERSISGVFTVSHSTNGSSWTQVSGASPANIQMASTVYIGLAVTSHNADATCEAVFTDVTTTGNVTGQWANQDIGIASNDPEPLYMALTDSAGNTGIVENEDPAAAQASEWTPWPVDLAAFADQGVNIGAVKEITLGAGSRTAPTAGGSGKLFFDDIAIGNPVELGEPMNLLTNGGFEDGVLEPWGFWGDASAEIVQELTGAAVPEEPAEGDSCLHITVNSAGANDWDYGLNQGGFAFEAGKRYTISVFLKTGEGEQDIRIKPELAASPWTGFNEQVITMTDTWTEYHVTTPVFGEDTSPASVTFHLAFAPGEFYVDGVKFYEGDYVQSN